MKVRSPTHALTKTYVHPKTVAGDRSGRGPSGRGPSGRGPSGRGPSRYVAKIVLEDGSEFDCTRDSMKDAVSDARKRAGIKI